MKFISHSGCDTLYCCVHCSLKIVVSSRNLYAAHPNKAFCTYHCFTGIEFWFLLFCFCCFWCIWITSFSRSVCPLPAGGDAFWVNAYAHSTNKPTIFVTRQIELRALQMHYKCFCMCAFVSCHFKHWNFQGDKAREREQMIKKAITTSTMVQKYI